MSLGQAELHLARALERRRRRQCVAAMLRVEPVCHRAAIVGEGEVRADPIHLARIAWCRGAGTGLEGPKNELSRRRPIFPGSCPPSIFGAGELNFRVRDGNGWFLSASVTGIDLQLARPPSMDGERTVDWKLRSSMQPDNAGARTRSSSVLDA